MAILPRFTPTPQVTEGTEKARRVNMENALVREKGMTLQEARAATERFFKREKRRTK